MLFIEVARILATQASCQDMESEKRSICCGGCCGDCFGPWEVPVWECCGMRSEVCYICSYWSMCTTSESCCPNCIGGTFCILMLAPLLPLSVCCDLTYPFICCGICGPNWNHCWVYKGRIPTHGCGCDHDKGELRRMLEE